MVTLQIISCVGCGKVILFCLMADAESPQTLFNILKTHFPSGVRINMSYDNGCNLIHYILNREPEMLKTLRIYIDNMHFTSHSRCLMAFDTSTSLGLAAKYALARLSRVP